MHRKYIYTYMYMYKLKKIVWHEFIVCFIPFHWVLYGLKIHSRRLRLDSQ